MSGFTFLCCIVDNSEKSWFRANELVGALVYLDIKDVIKRHFDKKNKIQLQNINHDNDISGQPKTNYLNEAGMYKMIL